jgi:hypothetical protein
MNFENFIILIGRLAKIVENEFPPNFLKLVHAYFITPNGLGKICIILALFFSFNFYSYIYIKAGLLELERDRLHAEELDAKWNDLFEHSNPLFGQLYTNSTPPYYVGFNEMSNYTSNRQFHWNPIVTTNFYVGLNGQSVLLLDQFKVTGVSTLETICIIKSELATPLFEVLSRKPNTSFSANVLYLLWLPFSIDEKNRLLLYKQKELGEIVLEIFRAKAVYSTVNHFQKLSLPLFMATDFRFRRFAVRNMQILIKDISK